MKIYVINGPNLNMLGIREPDHYGNLSYSGLLDNVKTHCDELGIEVEFYQSNHEGDLVDYIQKAYFEGVDGIVINPGAYTHTSIAILDAVKSVCIPTIEVHISDLSHREDFRQRSYIRLACFDSVIGQ
ncbi:MAG: 3-dehydroquinate dehydratase [Clostridia bacterium]|nr:3-dehydroquinate dehydratase [Clostridia bacterium]